MPSDTSLNLKTSATAAFFSRLCVHPLDNVRASLKSIQGSSDGIQPMLAQLRRHIVNIQVHDRSSTSTLYGSRSHTRYSPYTILSLAKNGSKGTGQNMIVWKNLYGGVSFALTFQVPALALFLTSYDGTKHGLNHLAQTTNISCLQIDNCGNHFLSGLIAKASGTLIWSPMSRLQAIHTFAEAAKMATVATSKASASSSTTATSTSTTAPASTLSIKEALRIGRHICKTEGLAGLWSGYSAHLALLLPYTMLYFATYEQLKQVARKIHHRQIAQSIAAGGAAAGQGSADILNQHIDQGVVDRVITACIELSQTWFPDQFFQPIPIPVNYDPTVQARLNPETYMTCVAGAVMIAATVSHTASAARKQVQLRLNTRPAGFASTLASASKLDPLANSAPSSAASPTTPGTATSSRSGLGFASQQISNLVTAQRIVSSTSHHVNQGHQHHLRHHTHAGLPWQQLHHAAMATPGSNNTLSRGHHIVINSSGYSSLSFPQKLGSPTTPTFTSSANFAAAMTTATTFSTNNTASAQYNTLGSSVTKKFLMTKQQPHSGIHLNLHSGLMIMNNTNNDNTNNMSQYRNATVTSLARHQPKSLVKILTKGLGSRIMWTIPGVALTTAGFEVLRSMAVGPE